MHTILVIEDQPVLASAYRNKFQSAGFKVEVALDGEQGLELIGRIKPDLVLLDMHLPRLSGTEVLKKVRANPEFQALPIIVFSNLTKPGAVEDAWQSGATLVLSKLNTTPNRVLESVKTTLASAASSIVAETLPGDETPLPAPLPTATSQPTSAGKILLVEDHSDMRTLLSFLLHRAGHQVTGVKTSSDALQQVSAQPFDLFVLGGESANGAVLALCQQLRKAGADKPIVVYSTAALFLEQQAGMKAGATAYLAKPEDLFNIGQIVSDLIRVRLAPRHLHAA